MQKIFEVISSCMVNFTKKKFLFFKETYVSLDTSWELYILAESKENALKIAKLSPNASEKSLENSIFSVYDMSDVFDANISEVEINVEEVSNRPIGELLNRLSARDFILYTKEILDKK